MLARDHASTVRSIARRARVVLPCALALLGATACASSDRTLPSEPTGSEDASSSSGGDEGGRDAGDDDGDDDDGDGDGDGDGAGDGDGDGDGETGVTVGTSSGSSGSAGEGSGGGDVVQTPVRLLPGLTSITFYETTNQVVAYTFDVDGPELSSMLADPLGNDAGADIAGAPSEYYDVYYSDENGAFDLDGSYLSISGVFDMTQPYGGGLNLAEIALVLSDGSEELGNYVASFVALGDNADPESASRCIDGDVGTYTTMGNTFGSEGRLRLTLGFLSTSGPPGALR